MNEVNVDFDRVVTPQCKFCRQDGIDGVPAKYTVTGPRPSTQTSKVCGKHAVYFMDCERRYKDYTVIEIEA